MVTPDALGLKELRELSPKKIEKMQRERFAATATYFYPHVPAYAQLAKEHNVNWSEITSPEDWHAAGLPLIKKAWFMTRPRDFILNVERDEVFKLHSAYASALGLPRFSLALKGLTARAELEKELKRFYTPHFPAFSAGTEAGIPSVVLFTHYQKNVLLQKVISLVTGLWLP